MSIFDTLRKTAEAAAQTASVVAGSAVKQTKTMASIGRLKLAITTEEDKLKKAYTELGRLYYRDYTAQAEANMEEYLPWCEKAEAAKKEIYKLSVELAEIKNASAEPEDPEVEIEYVVEDDSAIFADLEEAPVEVAPEMPVAEAPAQAAPTVETKPAEAPAEETAPEASVIPETPVEGTVGTLYVDITGQE